MKKDKIRITIVIPKKTFDQLERCRKLAKSNRSDFITRSINHCLNWDLKD